MPSWLIKFLTVLSPGQGLYLAILGTLGLAFAIIAKRPKVRMGGLAVYMLGGYGFASMLVGFFTAQ